MGLRKAVGACALSCAIALISGCSPYGGGSFACSMDMQCGAGGVCSDGFCSFPDPSCGSGLRWGELSGPFSNQCVGDQLPIDARPLDTNTPSEAGGESCFGTGLVKPCFTTMPAGDKTVTGTIDTASSPMCDMSPGNAAWCVIAGDSISVTATATVIGSRPLVLVATSSLDVPGILDVASHRAPSANGAGAVPAGNTTLCNIGTLPGTSGGGAGGSFGAVGGQGGNSTQNGGTSGAVMPATALRGGCAGQDGNNGAFGVKGLGGGAVYLIASATITIGGSINASGAAGSRGFTGLAGGGGGGSGGMIVFDAPTVTNSGEIFANGGGGAEGSGNATPGNHGSEPTSVAAAPATASASNGGEGGNGGADGTAAGTGAQNTTYGGGGGGGGVGVIKLYGASTIGGAGQISPPPS